MRSSFEVTCSTGRYPVHIGPGLIDEAMAARGDRVFVVDAFFAARFQAAGLDPLVVAADENAKSLARMTDVIVALRDRCVTRATHLVAVGGGVVQDVATFAASIYMRGLSWTYAPTTLLAMTDSCIGGKSAINVGAFKNVVGTFHPPAAVLIDPVLTNTLTAEQRAAGLIEAAKICLCRGPNSFEHYLSLTPTAAADAETLAAVCGHSLRAKKWFVERDEFDQDERLLLNFGHTFGHAIEAASGFAIGHAVAVGLGMLAALRLGEAMGRDHHRHAHLRQFEAHIATLVEAAPATGDVLARLDMPALLEAFGSDKKHGRDHFVVITIGSDGLVQRECLPRDARSIAAIERAYRAMIADRLAPPAIAA